MARDDGPPITALDSYKSQHSATLGAAKRVDPRRCETVDTRRRDTAAPMASTPRNGVADLNLDDDDSIKKMSEKMLKTCHVSSHPWST